MNKKSVATILGSIAIAAILIARSGAQQTPATPPVDPKQQLKDRMLGLYAHPKNLKILPKTISPKDLQSTMLFYAKSLGVHCNFCHVENETPAGKSVPMNYASDSKDEKQNARKMIQMTRDINKKYLQKIDKSFEEISCVSCHRGSPRPMVSVDSLPKEAKK